MFLIDFEFQDNAVSSHTFQWLDTNGTPINLTGMSFLMDVKVSANDEDAALSLSSPSTGIVITSASGGEFTITFPQEGLAPGVYVYDLIRIASSVRYVMAKGTITVTKGVTGIPS